MRTIANPADPKCPGLERAKLLIRMGEDAAHTMLPLVSTGGRYQDAHLWILFQGFANGFTAVIDTVSKAANRKDSPLGRAYARWWLGIAGEYRVRVKTVRNLLGHHGKFYTTEARQTWVADPANDTNHPVLSHVFATVVRGGREAELTFDEWARNQFGWLRSQLAELERLYRRELRAAERQSDYQARLQRLGKPSQQGDEENSKGKAGRGRRSGELPAG